MLGEGSRRRDPSGRLRRRPANHIITETRPNTGARADHLLLVTRLPFTQVVTRDVRSGSRGVGG